MRHDWARYEKIIDLYRQGVNLHEIARRVGFTHQAIIRILKFYYPAYPGWRGESDVYRLFVMWRRSQGFEDLPIEPTPSSVEVHDRNSRPRVDHEPESVKQNREATERTIALEQLQSAVRRLERVAAFEPVYRHEGALNEHDAKLFEAIDRAAASIGISLNILVRHIIDGLQNSSQLSLSDIRAYASILSVCATAHEKASRELRMARGMSTENVAMQVREVVPNKPEEDLRIELVIDEVIGRDGTNEQD